MIDTPALVGLGFATAVLATVGGLGGAVLLVPALVLAGLDPAEAAPLGLLAVAAGSLAAAPAQIASGLVNHRVGVVTETAASTGAVGGAIIAGEISADALRILLATAAMLAGLAALTRSGGGVDSEPAFVAETPGEWPGTLAGAEPAGVGVRPYQARRVGRGSMAMLVAGLVAGVSGTSGGYLKTPIASQVMGMPVRVAAATTTFTVGLTAASALLVFVIRGHLDASSGAAVVTGSLIGGWLGARVQRGVPGRAVQVVLSVALLGIAAVLVIT